MKLGKNHRRAVKNLCNARWENVVSYVHEINFVICIFKDITIKILFSGGTVLTLLIKTYYEVQLFVGSK